VVEEYAVPDKHLVAHEICAPDNCERPTKAQFFPVPRQSSMPKTPGSDFINQ